jgi:Zn-dependent protease
MDLSAINWRMLLLGFPVLLLALSVHESAHAWMADRCGDPTARLLGRVTLNPIPHIDLVGTILLPLFMLLTNIPLIGWAKPVPVNSMHFRHPSRDEILVSVAGPASNLLLAIALYILYVAAQLGGLFTAIPRSFAEPLYLLLYIGVSINVLLLIFNLIPIPPLDGSHVLENLLPYNARQRYLQLAHYGWLLLLVLLWVGVFRIILLPGQLVVDFLFNLV